MLNFITEKIFKGNKNIAFITMSALFTILLIVIIALFVNGCGTNIKNYSDLENELISAANKYYKDNEDRLPTTDGSIQSVSDTELVEGKYIKELNKLYTKDTCSANVEVIKSGENYLYVPNLKCAKYETKVLVNEITSKVVTKNDGLYHIDDEYVFKGDYVDNYIKFGDSVWRIISIDSTGIKIYLTTEKLDKTVWDDRYNTDKETETGKNVFETSRIKDALEEAYSTNKFISENNRQYLVNADWCIGGVKNETLTSKVNLCNEKSKQYIGLFYVDDFAKASLEPECKNFDDVQCKNYNYLASLKTTDWTLNYYTGSSYQAYNVSKTGVNYGKTSRNLTLRPVVYLNSKIRYISGTGTEKDPYIIK
ncbi:MAG: hypothetical protein NC181_03160 [Clostridium sp.]|nr:hypothetical protein [Clostridium sp.]MCM1444235.1 hypothetical protein [Candidatus Amulumruptor caecigallinarius]